MDVAGEELHDLYALEREMRSRIDCLKSKGVYSLIIFLNEEANIAIGSLGSHNFFPGYYVYTGSAHGPGGLRSRIKHHVHKNDGKKFWHIDFFIGHADTTIVVVISAPFAKKMECSINREIKMLEKAKIPVKGFGASDCKENCKSHLSYFGRENVKLKILKIYAKKSEPVLINLNKTKK